MDPLLCYVQVLCQELGDIRAWSSIGVHRMIIFKFNPHTFFDGCNPPNRSKKSTAMIMLFVSRADASDAPELDPTETVMFSDHNNATLSPREILKLGKIFILRRLFVELLLSPLPLPQVLLFDLGFRWRSSGSRTRSFILFLFLLLFNLRMILRRRWKKAVCGCVTVQTSLNGLSLSQIPLLSS